MVDHGGIQRLSVSTLTVTILDVNDNRPYFIDDPYLFTLSEHAALGTLVGEIRAGDTDLLDNRRIRYEISDVVQVNVEKLYYDSLFVEIMDELQMQ